VPTVLLATDADSILDEVDAALADADTAVYRVRQGVDVLQAIDQISPDLVILDAQTGNMGGMATCMAIRNAEGVDRIPITAVLVLLDRAHDAFLARRVDADGYLVKPLDAFRLRRAARVLLDGEAWFEPIDPTTSQPADVTLQA
jgi:two-component system response regulator VanR